MSAPILGALAGKKTHTHDEFIGRFLETLTTQERNALSQIQPGVIKRVEHVILFVIEMRKIPRYPLPARHPLNPASRYQDVE